jgi:hypothetical protein
MLLEFAIACYPFSLLQVVEWQQNEKSVGQQEQTSVSSVLRVSSSSASLSAPQDPDEVRLFISFLRRLGNYFRLNGETDNIEPVQTRFRVTGEKNVIKVSTSRLNIY